jgi:chemotaxis protein methyltransferase CheR
MESGSDRRDGVSEGAYQLSQRQFHRLAHFIEDYSGIKMPPAKKVMVEGRLRRRAAVLGFSSLDAYCNHFFEQGEQSLEVIPLIDAITTNKTEFFRERQHFHFLLEQGLPTLAKSGGGREHTLNVWSAACSIGAEPYSLAIVLNEFGANIRGYRFSVLATDLSTDVLSTALLGIYPEAMIAPVPLELKRRYFLRSRDQTKRNVRVIPSLRAKVHFARLNLIDQQYNLDNAMDVIFCRNILIYFDKRTQEHVLLKLCHHLRPGGYLIIGHSETTVGFSLPLKSVAPTIFRRENP